MTYSNGIVTTSQTTTYTALPIPYTALALIADIPHDAQLEVERVFTSAAATAYLEDPGISLALKAALFVIPTSRFTFNPTTKYITAVDFGGLVVSHPGHADIVIPAFAEDDVITVRRKTVSNMPLVNWTPGAKLSASQLNTAVSQCLYLNQEILDRLLTRVLQVDADGSLTTLVLAGTPVNTFSAATGDIDMGGFSLSNIEAGSWTPVLECTTTTPTLVYGTQQGYYMKVGKMVMFHGRLRLTERTGGAGNYRISGLPFTSHATATLVNISYMTGVSLGSGNIATFALVLGSDTRMQLYMQQANGQTGVSYDLFDNTMDCYFSGTYQATT